MKNKINQLRAPATLLFRFLIVGWLALLSWFSVWAWNQHMWQAKADSEAIYHLMVENGKQQFEIDELKAR